MVLPERKSRLSRTTPFNPAEVWDVDQRAATAPGVSANLTRESSEVREAPGVRVAHGVRELPPDWLREATSPPNVPLPKAKPPSMEPPGAAWPVWAREPIHGGSRTTPPRRPYPKWPFEPPENGLETTSEFEERSRAWLRIQDDHTWMNRNGPVIETPPFVGRRPSSESSVRVIGTQNASSLAMEMVRQFPKFRFDGDRANFRRWQDQWEEYLQLVRHASSEPLDSYMLLVLLRERLDETTGREIALRMKDPHTQYDEVYAEICRRFGSEVGVFRNRWKRVKLHKVRGEVAAAEWRRFRVELKASLSQDFGGDEEAVREHVLTQLPEGWRLAAIRQERRSASQNFWVRVGVPQGENPDNLYADLAAEVEGLGRCENDGRSLRIDCRSRQVQSRMLELNGYFFGAHVLRVCLSEVHCSIEELCQVVDQLVEEREELRMFGETTRVPVQVVQEKQGDRAMEDEGRSGASVGFRGVPAQGAPSGGPQESWPGKWVPEKSRESWPAKPQEGWSEKWGKQHASRGKGKGSGGRTPWQTRSWSPKRSKEGGPWCQYCASRNLDAKHLFLTCKVRLGQAE